MSSSARENGTRAFGEILRSLRVGIVAQVRDLEWDFDAALAGRPRAHRVHPAAEMAEPFDVDTRPFVGASPLPVGDIGDGVIAGEPLALPETCVEHLEKPAALVLVAVDGRLNLLGEVAEEDVRLPHHRTDPAHLEHEPLDDPGAA